MQENSGAGFETFDRLAGEADAPEAQEGMALGPRLKEFRAGRGFSLEQLAEKSGVSRSAISKIERGEVTPTTTNLAKLAEALGTTFAELMSPPSGGEVVVLRAKDQPRMIDDKTGFERRCIAPILPSRGLDWVLNTLPKGQSTGQFVPHSVGVEEYIYVLSGELDALLDRQSHPLSAGDALFFRAHVTHEFIARGTGPCQYLLIIDSKSR